MRGFILRRALMNIQGRRRAIIGTMAVLGCAACQSPDTMTVPPHEEATFFQTFQFDVHTYNVALASPYDTTTLHIAATFGDGAPVAGRIQYSVSDSTVTVDSAGRLTAHFTTVQPAVVRATLAYDGLTRRDSVLVNVTDAPPPSLPVHLAHVLFPSETFQLVAMISAEGGLLTPIDTLRIVPTTAAGDSLFGLLVTIASSKSTVASYQRSTVRTGDTVFAVGNAPGTTTLSAETFAYGRILSDSVVLTVGTPLYGLFDFVPRDAEQSPPRLRVTNEKVHIGVGGQVVWQNTTNSLVDVVFDDTANVAASPLDCDSSSVFALLILCPNGHPGAGNIAPFKIFSAELEPGSGFFLDLRNNAIRRFPIAGTYPWHSTTQDAHGTVIVCDELLGPCPE